MRIILLWSVILGLLYGCQSGKQKRQRPRAIYDQSCFTALYEQAASDKDAFEQFKRDPFFNLICENLSYEEGLTSAQAIREKYPFLMSRLEQFRANDQIGHPRLFHYEDLGMFSPQTLRYIEIAGRLQSQFGDLSGKHIVLIGSGYGGLCKILHDFFPSSRYTLIDLPAQLQLARKYLACLKVDEVKLCALEDLPKETMCDCVISDRHFSEFGRLEQGVLMEKVLKKADLGLLVGYTVPQHFGVISLSYEAIKHRLSQQEKRVWIETSHLGDLLFFSS